MDGWINKWTNGQINRWMNKWTHGWINKWIRVKSLAELAAFHPRDLVLNTTIPEFSAFKVALACRKPVQMHDPKSAAAESIRRLADELMERIQQRKQQREAA